MSAAYTAEDYLGAMQALMPRGRVWSRDIDSLQARLLLALVRVYERSDASAHHLLVDAFPQTAVDLLPEWEATLGLPDSCAGAADTLIERQALVVAKLLEPGGMSKAYFLKLAAALGYVDTTITEFGPTHCQMSCEAPLMDESWRFVWEVNLPHETTSITTQFGPTHCEMDCEVPVTDVIAQLVETIGPHSIFQVDSRSDERVDSYKFGALECMFMRLKPAHTYVMFSYRGLA